MNQLAAERRESAVEDYYAILGVARDASTEEIRRAYKRAIRAAHPDMGGSVEQAAAINQAWETLKDEGRRASYNFDLRMQNQAKQSQESPASAAEEAMRQARMRREKAEEYFEQARTRREKADEYFEREHPFSGFAEEPSFRAEAGPRYRETFTEAPPRPFQDRPFVQTPPQPSYQFFYRAPQPRSSHRARFYEWALNPDVPLFRMPTPVMIVLCGIALVSGIIPVLNTPLTTMILAFILGSLMTRNRGWSILIWAFLLIPIFTSVLTLVGMQVTAAPKAYLCGVLFQAVLKYWRRGQIYL